MHKGFNDMQMVRYAQKQGKTRAVYRVSSHRGRRGISLYCLLRVRGNAAPTRRVKDQSLIDNINTAPRRCMDAARRLTRLLL